MTARQRFRIYARVKWSEEALRNRGRRRRHPDDRGIVCAYSRDGKRVYVQKQGTSTLESYLHELWEAADD